MTTPITTVMKYVMGVVILAMALTITLRFAGATSRMVTEQKHIISERPDSALILGAEENDSIILSYAEVIAMFVNGLEYDTLIGMNFIDLDVFDPTEFNLLSIEPGDYKEVTYYDSKGQIFYIDLRIIR